MYNSTAMIILEVIEPNKAPDVKYISIGDSDSNLSDSYLESKAVSVFKDAKEYPDGTLFNIKGLHRFDSLDSYLKFLNGQLQDYLNSDEE